MIYQDAAFGGFNHTMILNRLPDGGYDPFRFSYLSHWPAPKPFVHSGGAFVIEKKIFNPTGDFQSGQPDARLPGMGFQRNVALFEDADRNIIFQKGAISWYAGSTLQRYRLDGTVDPSFHSISFPVRTLASGHLLPSNKFLIHEREYSPAPTRPRDGPYSDSRIRRLFPDGRIDPSFKVVIPPTDKALIYATLPVGDEIWVAGNFTEIGGEPRNGFARLSARDTPSFTAWIAACLPDSVSSRSALDDPDFDGASNLEEYAAGTDPLSSGSIPGISSRDGWWTTQANPDALEVARQFEVSDDLRTWRRVLPHEVETRQGGPTFQWRLLTPSRYCRLVTNLR